MTTPFDRAIAMIADAGYHNHRLETHSDTVSDGLFRDLLELCEPLRRDVQRGLLRVWKNVSAPGDRLRKVDLVVGEPDISGGPDLHKVRIALENKSVITAHRNRTNRFDDLRKVLAAVHGARPEALLVATVLVGISERVLNIPNQVHKLYRRRENEFERDVRPRLSSGDATLWDQFAWAVSTNRPTDPGKTVELFQTLPTRKPGHTHVEGYDYVLLVPVQIDNVNPPHLPRPNILGIDVDKEYRKLLLQMCSAYTARWHL
ncbi:MAG: hypothetical protein ACRERD_09490 [Candidatus Binatia bacterium]